MSAAGPVLSGSAPVHMEVIDPFGVVRHELYRATKLGQFQAAVPLAANDPSGTWVVRLEDPIFKSSTATSFRYDAPARARGPGGGDARGCLLRQRPGQRVPLRPTAPQRHRRQGDGALSRGRGGAPRENPRPVGCQVPGGGRGDARARRGR